MCSVCNPRETTGVLREHAYAVRALDGDVRKYAQEHSRVHRRDRQRQANAAEQPKATQVVEAPALAILDVKGDPEAHEAREQRTRDGQAHNLLAARLRPALFAARGEQCFANLRRLGLLSASGLSSFFTFGTYTANLLVDAPYRLPMRRMTPGFDGSGIYVLGHLVLNLALPATLSAVVRDVAVGAVADVRLDHLRDTFLAACGRATSADRAEALEALAKTIRGARVGIADERQALEAQLATTRQLLDAALQKKKARRWTSTRRWRRRSFSTPLPRGIPLRGSESSSSAPNRKRRRHPLGPSYTTKQLVVDLAQLNEDKRRRPRRHALLDDDHVASLQHEAATHAKHIDDLDTLAHATVVAWAGGVCARRLVTTFVQRRMILSVDEVLGLADPDLADVPFGNVGDGATLEDLKRHTAEALETMHPVRRRIVDKLGIAAVTSVRDKGSAARLRHFCLDLLEGFRAYQTDSVGNTKTLQASEAWAAQLGVRAVGSGPGRGDWRRLARGEARPRGVPGGGR